MEIFSLILLSNISYSVYNSYGNHCGYEHGSNLAPIDQIDQCCMEHDVCGRYSEYCAIVMVNCVMNAFSGNMTKSERMQQMRFIILFKKVNNFVATCKGIRTEYYNVSEYDILNNQTLQDIIQYDINNMTYDVAIVNYYSIIGVILISCWLVYKILSIKHRFTSQVLVYMLLYCMILLGFLIYDRIVLISIPFYPYDHGNNIY
jgi:hypothetical protein